MDSEALFWIVPIGLITTSVIGVVAAWFLRGDRMSSEAFGEAITGETPYWKLYRNLPRAARRALIVSMVSALLVGGWGAVRLYFAESITFWLSRNLLIVFYGGGVYGVMATISLIRLIFYDVGRMIILTVCGRHRVWVSPWKLTRTDMWERIDAKLDGRMYFSMGTAMITGILFWVLAGVLLRLLLSARDTAQW